MPDKWSVRTVGECASTEPYSTQIGPFGKALMANKYTSSGVPVLRGVNVNRGRFHDKEFVFVDDMTADRLSKFESYPGDVLLVHKGTLGKIGLMPTRRRYRRYIMGNSMMRVRCDTSKLLPEFLYYWLSSANGQHYLFSRVSQVGVPQLQTPLTTLRRAELPVPPLPEQRAITHILATLDDKIDANRLMNETLEEMARALFQSWFVDFDPVRTKAEGRSTGLPTRLDALFPDSFEDSELGDVPKGWDVRRLGDYVQISRETLDPAEFPDERFDHFSLPAFDAQHRPAIDFGRDIKSIKHVVRQDSVLFSKLNPAIPRVWRVQRIRGRRQIASTEFLVFQPLRGAGLTREWIYGLASSQSFRAHAISGVTGTSNSHQRARAADALDFRISVPPLALVDTFSTYVEPMLSRVEACQRDSESLAETRDALLPKLVSGELRVKDAGRIAERVA